MMAAPKGHKYTVGNKGGRPLKYETVEELEEIIDNYFNSCIREVIVRDKDGHVILDEDGNVEKELKMVKPITVTGLAIAIGLTRDTLIRYEDRSEKFYDTITHAKQKCQEFAEEQLYLAKSANGPAFSLKNNWGWKDKTEQEITGANGADFVIKIKRKSEDE